MDTGAAVSLIHKRLYESLKINSRIEQTNLTLQSASGSRLNVLGTTVLKFKVNRLELQHTFVIVNNLSRNCILGKDFLAANSCRIYFDLNCIRIKGEYVAMQEDKCIASIIRLSKTTVLKPQTVYRLQGKLKNNPSITNNVDYEVCAVDTGYISQEPNLQLSNALIYLRSSRRVPVVITNHSNKHVRLKRGCVIAKLNRIGVMSIDTCDTTGEEFTIPDIDLNDIKTPKERLREIQSLISKYKDVISSCKDSNRDHTRSTN